MFECFPAARARPCGAATRPRAPSAQDGVGLRSVVVGEQDQLHRAFGERNLTGECGQSLVSQQAAYSRRFEQVLQMMNFVQCERRIERFHAG